MSRFTKSSDPSLFSIKSLPLLKKCITEKGTLLARDSVIIFTCGARPDAKNPCIRDTFLKYAYKHLRQFHFFKAEDIFPVLFKKNHDWLSIEDKLADLSDCIIIILESAGSLVELGAFSIKDSLAEILLIVNDKKYKGKSSFIEKGPIQKLNQKSIFGPVIYTNFDSFLRIVRDIKDRLKKIKRIYRKKIDLSGYYEFKKCNRKIRLLFLYDLVSFFNPLKIEELEGLLKYFYDLKGIKLSLDLDLGVLQAMNLLNYKDHFFTSTLDNRDSFFEYSKVNIDNFRAEIFAHYFKFKRERLKHLSERALN